MPREGQTQTNSQTGERRMWYGGRWKPITTEKTEVLSQGDSGTPEAVKAAVLATGEVLSRWGSHVGMGKEPDPGILSKVREDYPLATLGGDLAPFAATAPLSGGIAVQTGIGTALGALDTGTAEGAVKGGAFSFGATTALKGAGRAWNALMGNPAVAKGVGRAQDLLREAQAMGFRLLPGQVANSRMGRMVDASLESSPLSGAIAHGARQSNAKLMGNISAKSMGVEADDVSEVVMQHAADKMSGQFKGVAKKLGTDVDISNVAADIKELGLPASILKKYPLDGSAWTGEQVMGMRSILSDHISDLTKTTGQHMQVKVVRDLIESLDDSVINPKLDKGWQNTFRTVRERWRNKIALQSGGVTNADGSINSGALYSALKGMWGTTFKEGRAERVLPETQKLFRASRVTANPAFRSVVGNSGTAERAALPLIAAGVGAGQGLAGDESPVDIARRAIMYGAIGYGAPKAYSVLGTAAPAPLAGQVGGAVGRLAYGFDSSESELP